MDDFATLLSAFRSLDFDQTEIDGVMALIAGVLTIGNIEFTDDAGTGHSQGSKALAGAALADVARLWGSTEAEVHSAVTKRTLEIRGVAEEATPPHPHPCHS